MGQPVVVAQPAGTTAGGYAPGQAMMDTSTEQPIVVPEASLDEEIATIRVRLGLPGHEAPADVAKKGLQSEDLEIARRALHAAVLLGSGSSAQAQETANRIRLGKGLPQDWDIQAFARGRFLEGGSGGRLASAVIGYHLQPRNVVNDMQSLFDATYRKVYTRDRRGAPMADRFIVKDVLRVMNDQVWREYTSVREGVRTKLSGSNPRLPGGAATMNYVLGNKKSPLPLLDTQVNENWLFHGTTRAAAEGIAENDFRLDLTGSNAGTLYGKGIYLAENVSKSDEYGEGPKGPAGEEQMEAGYEADRPKGPPPPLVRESFMLVCRSTLGKVLYTDKQRPDPNDLQKSCTGGEYHCVLGDRLKINGTYREIVVYSDDQVYPEYIVRYERIFFHERFAQIFDSMVMRRKAKQFNGPLPEEKKVLESLWNVFAMPNKGRINKWQLLDLLKAIDQPPENEGADLDDTFAEWNTKGDGWIDWDQFLQEMITRVKDLGDDVL